MVNKLGKTVTLKGASGREYLFELYTFDKYDDVKGAFIELAALYLFGKLNADQSFFEYIYLGETNNLYTRYDNHLKEDCIKRYGANGIGICALEEFRNEAKRKAAEKDILEAINFPCNDKNN
jgi:hypothetical protein